MSNIPAARIAINDIIMELRSGRVYSNDQMTSLLVGILNDLYRGATKERAKATSKKMTPALGREIRTFVDANSDLSLQAIANLFGVNPGRVSEAVAGKW